MDIIWIWLLILICISIYFNWHTTNKRHNLPPGPTPLPLIGNLLHIKRNDLVTSLIKLWDRYGAVYTLYFGSQPVVVLCGYEAVKEALVDRGEEFGGRGPLPILEKFTEGYGFTLSNGERWRILRTFTIKTLKSFGFGKKSYEWKIQKEAQCVVDELKKFNGHPLDPTKKIMDAVSNVICSIIFGDDFVYRDERFTKLLGIVDETFHLATSTRGQLLRILPTFMNHIPGPHQKIIRLPEELIEFIHERVNVSLETLDLNSPRHFIDSFLIKIEEEKNNPNTEFHLKNLLVTTRSLFLAGIETVKTTLRHALLILLTYPEVQDAAAPILYGLNAKLHDEIDRVIGRNRVPNFDDRIEMHYMQAVIHEIQRFCDIAPLNVPHMVTRDVQFRGYQIPKGTEVYTLLCTVHRDPKQFSSPWKFNPNHFLDESGKFKKNDAMMAFSAGKRICPGESLARMELFIFLTSILQNFNLTSKMEFIETEIAPKMGGFMNTPIHYELSFLHRLT